MERLSRAEIDIVISAVRDEAIQELDLTETEQLAIKESLPSVKIYNLSGTFAQYFISWDLPTGMTVDIWGSGDILILEGSEISKTVTENRGLWPKGSGSSRLTKSNMGLKSDGLKAAA